MSKTDWLWLAGAIIWLGFGLYLAWLGLRQSRLERRLEQLLRLQPENGDPFEALESAETPETEKPEQTAAPAVHSPCKSE